MSIKSIRISVWGLDLDVDYYYHKGYAGSLEQPPEPEEIEINEIRFIAGVEHNYNLEQLGYTENELQESQVFLAAVEQEIWDSFEYNKEYNYDDYSDDSYFDSGQEIEW